MKWIETWGGPIILMPAKKIGDWKGILPGRNKAKSDYDLACSVKGYLGVLKNKQYEILVFGDEPMRTSWVRKGNNGCIIRWIYADSEKSIEDVVNKYKIDILNSTDFHSFHVNGELLLFDSAEVGVEKPKRSINIEMPKGDYIIGTEQFEIPKKVSIVIHPVIKVDNTNTTDRK